MDNLGAQVEQVGDLGAVRGAGGEPGWEQRVRWGVRVSELVGEGRYLVGEIRCGFQRGARPAAVGTHGSPGQLGGMGAGSQRVPFGDLRGVLRKRGPKQPLILRGALGLVDAEKPAEEAMLIPGVAQHHRDAIELASSDHLAGIVRDQRCAVGHGEESSGKR